LRNIHNCIRYLALIPESLAYTYQLSYTGDRCPPLLASSAAALDPFSMAKD